MAESKGKSPVKSLYKILSQDLSRSSSKELLSKENRQMKKLASDRPSRSSDAYQSLHALKRFTSSQSSTSKSSVKSPRRPVEAKTCAPLTLLNRDSTYHASTQNDTNLPARQRATVMFDTDDGGQFVVSYDAPRSRSRSRVGSVLDESRHAAQVGPGRADSGSILRVAATFSENAGSEVKKLDIGICEGDMTSRTSRRLEATFIQEDSTKLQSLHPSKPSSEGNSLANHVRSSKTDHADYLGSRNEGVCNKSEEHLVQGKGSSSKLLSVSSTVGSCSGNAEVEEELADVLQESEGEDSDHTFNGDNDDDNAVSFTAKGTRLNKTDLNVSKPSRIPSYGKTTQSKSDLTRRVSLSSLPGQGITSKNTYPKATSSSRIPIPKGLSSSAGRPPTDCGQSTTEKSSKLSRRLSLSNMHEKGSNSSKSSRTEPVSCNPKPSVSHSADRDNNKQTVKSQPSKVVRSTSTKSEVGSAARINGKPPMRPKALGDRTGANTSNISLCSVGNTSISSIPDQGSLKTPIDREAAVVSSSISVRQSLSTSEPRVSIMNPPSRSCTLKESSSDVRPATTASSSKKQEMMLEGSIRDLSSSKLTVSQYQKRKEYDPKKAIEEARTKGRPPSGNRTTRTTNEISNTSNLSLRSLNDIALNTSWKNSSVVSEPGKRLKVYKSSSSVSSAINSKKIARTISTSSSVQGSQVKASTSSSGNRGVGKVSAASSTRSARSRMSSCSSDVSAASSGKGSSNAKQNMATSQSFCVPEKDHTKSTTSNGDNSLELPNWALEYLNDLSKAKSDQGNRTKGEGQTSLVTAERKDASTTNEFSNDCDENDSDSTENCSPEDNKEKQPAYPRDIIDSSADYFSKSVQRRASAILQQIQNGGISKAAETLVNASGESPNFNAGTSKDKQELAKKCI